MLNTLIDSSAFGKAIESNEIQKLEYILEKKPEWLSSYILRRIPTIIGNSYY